MIKAKNIHFSYGNLQVLKGLNLEIERGEFVSIVGASGSGKTTLLQLLGTLEKSDSGEIVVDGKSVQQLSEKELAIFRNQKIGFVFQFHNLLAEFSSLENVCLPAFIAGKNKKSVEKDATELLKMLRLENRLHHKPNELSGGEQQRVIIAKAIVQDPTLYLFDEPTSNLDLSSQFEILYEILNFLKMSKSDLRKLVEINQPKNYILDYGGPNIGKSMHVGHLRPLNIGRALYNIHSYSGHKCTSDIHLGDWGIPISQIITYCYEKEIEISRVTIQEIQKIYPKASKLYKDDEEFKKNVGKNLIELNKKDGEIFEDWKYLSNLTVTDTKSLLKKLNHQFDLFYGESDVVNLIPKMIESLEKEGTVKRDDGALISNESLEPPVLILKSDNSYLYMTTDLATVLDREKNLFPDVYLYIVDSRQSDHFRQLFSTVKYFGYSNAEMEHIGFGTINDSNGQPFKTRQGEVYPLEQLWKEIYLILLEKNTEETAKILTNSVLTFSDLLTDRKSNYKFDIKKFTSVEGKTAIYLQYTRVRIISLLKNFKSIKYSNNTSNEDLFDSEINLILGLIRFGDIFNRSKLQNEPHHLAEYLYEICQNFNSFYREVKIIDDSNINLQNRRINLLLIVLQIIDTIFNLLGIEPVDEM